MSQATDFAVGREVGEGGDMEWRDLATRYGISLTQVSKAARGLTYKEEV